MTDMYRITPEQEAFLNSFTCERLRDDERNKDLIQKFYSKRGVLLVNNLKNNGWNTDTKGSVAYYVIKNAAGEIVLFFSLKCGVIFDPNDLVAFVNSFTDHELYRVWYAAQKHDPGAIQKLQFMQLLMGKNAYDARINQVKAYHSIKNDKKNPMFANMVRVFEGHSAIELVEYCTDDHTKVCWDKKQMGQQRMGESLFWWIIYPKMQQISKLIGCDYVFLFAADKTPDGDLVQYYHDLHFSEMPSLGTVKPYYDMNCYFMGKRLWTLREDQLSADDLKADLDLKGMDYYQEEFFRYYNRNVGANDNA